MADETAGGGAGFDMEAAVDSISADLGFGKDDDATKDDTGEEAHDTSGEEAQAQEKDQVRRDAAATSQGEQQAKPGETQTRPAPKSWAKEQHEYWSKIDPKAQEYIELREKQFLDGLEQYKGDAGFGREMRSVMTPYKAMLQAQGVNEAQAAQYLLNAHYRLTSAQPAEKAQYFASLAKSYGIDIAGLQQQADVKPDPAVQALQQEVGQLKQTLTAGQQAAANEHRTKIQKDVEKFASDPAHPYFDDVSDDILAYINAGAELQVAYDKAVWANPVTRQKEIARLRTEQEASLREKAKAEAEAARRASSSNVRTRDTTKSSTETKGKLFGAEHDEELREIVRKGRTATH